MGRRVQTIDRAMVRSIVEVWLYGDLLAGHIPSVAATMRAIEMVKHRAPRLGIALLICKTTDGVGDHAVNRRLVVVGVRPPGTCPIPIHCRRIVCPCNAAGNDTTGNAQWGKRRVE